MDSKYTIIDRLMQKFPGVHKVIIMDTLETAGGDEDVCTGLCMSMLSEWNVERAKADRENALRSAASASSSSSHQHQAPAVPIGAMASSSSPPNKYAQEIEQLRQVFSDVALDRIVKVVEENEGDVDLCFDAFLNEEPPANTTSAQMGCSVSPMLWTKSGRVVDVVDVDDDTDTGCYFDDRVRHTGGLQKGGLAEADSDRDIPVPRDSEEDEELIFRECVARWCEMFPNIPKSIVMNVVNKNAERNWSREEQENATYNNLKKQEKKINADAPKDEGKRGHTVAQKQPPRAIVPAHTGGNTPNTPASSNRHHFHIFWDFDNVHSLSNNTKHQRAGADHDGRESVQMLQALKEYFADINPNSKKGRGTGAQCGNVVRLEGYFVPASRVSQFVLTTLRNVGLKVVMCSQKAGDADRQIKRNVLHLLDLLSMGLPPKDHTIVVVSADQDFTDCAEQVQHMGYPVWCVHNAFANSAHESVLRLMYDRVVSVAELPKPQMK